MNKQNEHIFYEYKHVLTTNIEVKGIMLEKIKEKLNLINCENKY